MITLAEFMTIADANNRPPMLEKSMYDSWKSRMELYIENRENGRMIFNSVLNGLLVWPTVDEENGTTRTKKYEELSVVENVIPKLNPFHNNKQYQIRNMLEREKGKMEDLLKRESRGGRPTISPNVDVFFDLPNVDVLDGEVVMIDYLSIVETDKLIHTTKTDMVKLVVEIKCFDMSVDEFDKEIVSSDGLQPKQVDQSCVHALNEHHLNEIHVVPSKNEANQYLLCANPKPV
nr:hypothetical protein [Tanacetum cinerariifolium]